MSGVDPVWVSGNDFVMVHPAMTKAMNGDFIAAGVAGRIKYLSNVVEADEDGVRWVDATAQEIADWMGLSAKQVRRALAVLLEHGFIIQKKRGLGAWDRGLSTALVFRGQD